MQFNAIKILLAATVSLFSVTAMAQDAEEETTNGWTGKGEFGFVNTTGNTESQAMNFNLEFIRESELWRHRFTANALMTSEDGNKDNERYQLEAQSDRKLTEVSYLFGAFRWDSDKFGAYDPQMTLTAGYGRELINTDNHHLKAEIGAGYRKLEERESGATTDEMIARFLVDDVWKITDTTEWGNRLLVETGSENTFTQFNTGLSVAMNAKFAVKVGFEVRNNTKVPPGDSEKTDTKTTVNLVYNF